MATLTRPTWLLPNQCTLALRKSGQQFVSPFNGTLQAIETLAERWVMSMNLAARQDGGDRSAFLNQWAGGVNLVPLYHFGRPQPLGSLRGAPTLASSTARGHNTLSLAGCVNTNRLLNGSFQTDSNADGLADRWTPYSTGAVSTVTFGPASVPGRPGETAQRVTTLSLGTSTVDIAGVYNTVNVSGLAGQTMTLSASVAAYDGTPKVALYITWRNAGGSIVASSSVSVSPSATLARYSLTATVPADATVAEIFIWMHSRTGSAGVAVIDIDEVQFELGSVASAYAGRATLRAGDMLGIGAQLHQVAGDCVANDNGLMTVPVVNRCRGTVVSNTVVVWDRPTALFALPAMESPTSWMRGGYVDSQMLDAVEVY